MAPSTVRIVLVEGEGADGVTVDQDGFDVGADSSSAVGRVVAAILGTRESAREGGYELSSTGVTWSDQTEAAALREALVDHKVENVMLVSAFLAAAALAQAVGSLTRYARTGLLFIEPDAATFAVVSSTDGSIAEVHRQALPRDDDRAVAELAAMVAGVDRLEPSPDGVFVVGSGVNIAMIKPELDKACPLAVSAPEEPELALARGAALASAHAPLFASSTEAVAWAKDPGTGVVDPALVSAGYAYVPAGPVDYDATRDEAALAYSAVPDDPASSYLPVLGEGVPADDPHLVDSRLLDFSTAIGEQGRKPFLVTGSGLAAVFVVGVVALVVALAVSIRPTHDNKPDVRANVVHPAHQTPAPPPKAQVPAPPPPSQQPPAPAAQPVPPQAPAPPREAPAPAPAPVAPAPAPRPAAPPPPPPPPALPPLQIPGLPGGPPVLGPPRGGGDWDDHGGWGHGDGHGRGRGGGGIPIPLPIPGLHLGLG